MSVSSADPAHRADPAAGQLDGRERRGREARPAALSCRGRRSTGRDLTRLDLARWLVSRDNPLTARTVMNRLWKQFFGAGLSKQLDDLGAQGEPPSNPALLDWLACEFMDSGWDMKHMVRTIVTSKTYRQTSVATPELLAADPLNRELARQSAYRVDAELVRDNALAVSGLLVPKIGGPSVKPYQPDGYWENLNFPPREYVADQGDAQYRRGLYTWWQRSFLHPSLLAFDAPSREECCAERNRSNIPQQALVLLNDPTYVEAARAFAARVLRECSGRPEDRLNRAWQLALQRDPRPAEAETVRKLLDKHLTDYRANPAAARALISTGVAPRPTGLTPPSSRPGPTSPACCSTSTKRSRGHETMNTHLDPTAHSVHRRAFLGQAAQGVGAVALASLLDPSLLRAAAQPPGACLARPAAAAKGEAGDLADDGGGPVAARDVRPQAEAGRDGRQADARGFTRGQQLAQLQGQKLVCLGPQFPFRTFGKNGTEISELFPHIGSVIDEICLIRSMTTEAINHDPAHMFMNTGSQIAGRPSMGAWVTYGLGSEAENLPGFVVLVSTGKGRSPQPIAARQWSSGFLPGRYPGRADARARGGRALPGEPRRASRASSRGPMSPRSTRSNAQHDAAGARPRDRHADRPVRDGVPDAGQRPRADGHPRREPEDARAVRLPAGRRLVRLELPARPPAGRARRAVHPALPPRLGPPQPAPRGAAPARPRGRPGVHGLDHRSEAPGHARRDADRVGRRVRPHADVAVEQGPVGRDHHNKAMSIWLAGAGIKPGLVYGATDELGYAAVENVCTVHDLHATMLHQLGIDHDAFSVKFQGLDARLTGVEGAKVIKGILA